MPDREKAIRILEGNYKNFVLRHNGELLTINELIALLKAQEPADYIPIDWLMNYAQLPTEFAISAWRKPKKEAEIKQAKSLDKPMSLDDALELLKAQEPRVMTLEEVKMLDRDYYYLEAMRSPGKELREIVGAYGLTCVTWPSITWARQTMGDGGYGKTWRCWTSRPTDEQREKVKWE